jgi:DnaJ-domain-containing protein 1
VVIEMLLTIAVALRAEWAMSKARAGRWSEEVDLVVEEMRRVLTFLMHRSKWWLEQISIRDTQAELADGIAAYAAKQSHIMRRMAQQFGEKWYKCLKDNNLETDWPKECIPVGRHS